MTLDVEAIKTTFEPHVAYDQKSAIIVRLIAALEAAEADAARLVHAAAALDHAIGIFIDGRTPQTFRSVTAHRVALEGALIAHDARVRKEAQP